MYQKELNTFKKENDVKECAVVDVVLRCLPAKYRRISIQTIKDDVFRILYFPTGASMADLPKALPNGALVKIQKRMKCNVMSDHIDVPTKYGMLKNIKVSVLEILKYDNDTTKVLDERKSHNDFNEFFKL